MTGDVKEPFGFALEADGSVGLLVYPASTDGTGPWRHVGHIRVAADGSVISSLTYEEPQDYDSWEAHGDVDEAVLTMLEDCMKSVEGEGLKSDRSYLLDLRRSASLAKEYSHRVNAALVSAARLALAAAVRSMLRLSTHDEVLKTVSDAMAHSVMEE